ncbi:unnamed protein product [Prunus brigantina]
MARHLGFTGNLSRCRTSKPPHHLSQVNIPSFPIRFPDTNPGKSPICQAPSSPIHS